MKKSRICANCGTELKEGTKFCYKCGQQYEDEKYNKSSTDARNEKDTVCKNCGFPIEENSQYCTKCGYKLDNDKKSRFKILSVKNIVITFVILLFVLFFINKDETVKNGLDDDTIGYIAWCVAETQLKYDSTFKDYEIVDSTMLDIDGDKKPVYFVIVKGNAENGFGASQKVKFEVVLINPSEDGDRVKWNTASFAVDFSLLSDDFAKEDLKSAKEDMEKSAEN